MTRRVVVLCLLASSVFAQRIIIQRPQLFPQPDGQEHPELMGEPQASTGGNPQSPPGTTESVMACVVPLPLNSEKVTWSAGPAIRGSGYHPHELTEPQYLRPPTKIEITVTYTDPGTGCTHTIVEWPWYAGIYPIVACATGTVNICDSGTYNIMANKAPISQAAAGQGYYFLADPSHNGLDYAMSNYEYFVLQDAGRRFYAVSGGASFRVNRAGLTWGGWDDNNTTHFATVNLDPHTDGSSHWDVAIPSNSGQASALLSILQSEPSLLGGGTHCSVTNFYSQYWDVDCE